MKSRLYQYETVWRASKRRKRSKTMSTNIAVLYDLWTLFCTILGYLTAIVINIIKGIELQQWKQRHHLKQSTVGATISTLGNVECKRVFNHRY